MHLKIQKRNGRQYLSVVQNYRQAGKTKTRTIETIGYADAYADRFEDPIAHFREHVAQLNAEAAQSRRPIELSFDPDASIDAEGVPEARLGAAIALGCLDAIGVRGFFDARAGREGFPPHAGRIFEMLAAERMMHATSKRESWTARSSFPRACAFSFEDVYAALPCFARERCHLDAHFANAVGDMAPSPNGPDRIFLVCGSYAFPVDGGAERASIAVAIDGEGMPLGYHDMDGYLDSNAFAEAARELKGRIGSSRAVIVAGGLRKLELAIARLASTGDGFVFYDRDLEQNPELLSWVLDDEGYAAAGGGVRMKARRAERPLPDGSPLPVQEVVLRGGGYGVRHGHAVLVSSELDLNPATIVQLFRELWRQAEPFQPLEADFLPIPYPISAKDHIRAHFALCYASFLALRVLRRRMGFKHNAADTADALLRMEGVHLQRNYYLFSYRSAVSDDIEQALGIPVARSLRTRAELRSIPKDVRASLARPSRTARASG